MGVNSLIIDTNVSLDEFITVNEMAHEVQGPLQTAVQFFLEEATYMYV
jgi:hypothetical protein